MQKPGGTGFTLREDVLVWARLWHRPVGLALIARLFFLEPGYQLALSIRLQQVVSRIPFIGKGARRILWFWTVRQLNCDVDPSANIGPGVYFPHPIGIVIGGNCNIGSNVAILQNVTIGRLSSIDDSGPSIGDGAKINAGAVIVGPVRIGEGAVVGANAVVRIDVPAGQIAVGVPARILTNVGDSVQENTL